MPLWFAEAHTHDLDYCTFWTAHCENGVETVLCDLKDSLKELSAVF